MVDWTGGRRITVLRALSLLDQRMPTADDIWRFAESAPMFLVIGAAGSLHALSSYLGAWTDWRLVDDCGDRLERILNAGRDLALALKARKRRPHRGRPQPGASVRTWF